MSSFEITNPFCCLPWNQGAHALHQPYKPLNECKHQLHKPVLLHSSWTTQIFLLTIQDADIYRLLSFPPDTVLVGAQGNQVMIFSIPVLFTVHIQRVGVDGVSLSLDFSFVYSRTSCYFMEGCMTWYSSIFAFCNWQDKLFYCWSCPFLCVKALLCLMFSWNMLNNFWCLLWWFSVVWVHCYFVVHCGPGNFHRVGPVYRRENGDPKFTKVNVY